MKIAVAQLASSPDKQANLAKAVSYIAKAKNLGADMIVIPEIYMVYNAPATGIKKADVAESIDGSFATGLAAAARSNNIYVVCGIFESKPGDEQRAYNTTVFFNREGVLQECYRKTHLYDAFVTKESNSIIPGDEPPKIIETEFGKIGLLVCYEVRFPEISRQLVLQGADVLIMPTAWVAGSIKEEHFEILVRARAIENTVYFCAADQIGNQFVGRSMIVDPMGIIIASIGEEEGMCTAEVDLDRVKRVREKLPCLANRRPELYQTIV